MVLDDLMSSISFRSLASRVLMLSPVFAFQPSTGDVNDYITNYNTNVSKLSDERAGHLYVHGRGIDMYMGRAYM